jgi:hypothetical protein
MAVKYPENGVRIPELRPNQKLIDIRKMFGIPGEYLLADFNKYYTNMNDNAIVQPIERGLPKALPITRDNDEQDRSGIMSTTPGSNFKILGDRTTTDLRNLTDAEFFGKIFGEEYSPYKSNEDLEPSLAGLGYDKDAGIMDFIKSGGLTGAIARGIGNLLPDQTMAEAMRNYYGKDNLDGIGRIQSGLMQGYSPVSGGLLNFLTEGRVGDATTYGLQRAYDKRIATRTDPKTLARIAKLSKEKQEDFAKKTAQLKAEKAAELRAIQEARARDDQRRIEDAYDTQTGAGSGYSGGEDTRAARTTGNYDDPFDPGYAD